MTYKDKVLMFREETLEAWFVLSFVWPYLVAYELGKMTDERPAPKVDPIACTLCVLGTGVPLIPMGSVLTNTPIEKAYSNTYNFFAKEEEKVSLPSANGLFACYLFTVFPVLPVLVVASLLTLVPLTILMMVMFEIVAVPSAAIIDCVYPETLSPAFS